MNDDERLELIRRLSPHQWSKEQSAEVAKAFDADSKVQAAVADQLRIEEALTLQFAPGLESTEAFLGKLQRRVRSQRRARRMKLMVATILLLAATGSGAFVAYERGWLEKLIVPQGVAQRDDTNDSKKDRPRKKSRKTDVRNGDTDDPSGDGKPDASDSTTGDPMPVDPASEPTAEPDGNEPMPDPPGPIGVKAEPFEPQWKLFDDAAVRGDFSWLSNIEALMQPVQGELQKQANNGTIPLNGKYKLQPPTADGRVIRLRMHATSRLSFLIECEKQNARIDFSDGWQLLAFVNSAESPEQFRAIGGDNGRWNSFRQGTLDLRYQQGQLILARGDMVLLAIPIGEPASITLDTQCQLKLAENLRLQPIVVPDHDAKPVAEADISPAQRKWSTEPNAEYAVVTPQQDGGLLFSRKEDSDSELRVGTIVGPDSGLTVTMRAAKVAPQSGFFFDTPDGQKNCTAYIVQQGNNRVLAVSPADPGEAARSAQAGFYVSDPFWCRGVYGLDFFRIEFSCDGQTWVTFLERPYAAVALDKPVQVGLCAANGPGPRGGLLTDFTISRPRGLEQFADAELVTKVPFAVNDRFGQPLPPALQLDGALGARPDGVTPIDWRKACYLALLNKATTPAGRHELASQLVGTAIESGAEFDKSLAALGELPSRLKISPNDASKLTWAKLQGLYDQLADSESQQGRPKNLEQILAAWYSQSFGPGGRDFQASIAPVVPPGTLRLAMFHGWHRYQWNDTFLRALRFECFSRQSDGNIQHQAQTATLGRVVSWIKEQASDRLPEIRNDDPNATRRKRRWPPHPLVDESDRESLNTISEFLAAIESEQFGHACRILTGQFVPDGIVALGDDGRLSKATHRLMREQVEKNEELRTKLRRDFGQLGELRIRQALQNKQFDSLETLATQFHGTPAAGKARLMLADRDLSMGNFFAAAAGYESLLDHAALDDRSTIGAKYRLALAVSGRLGGQPVTTTVHFDGQPIAADEFEQMIAQLVAERRAGGEQQKDAPAGPSLGPEPREMKLTPLVNAAAQAHGKYKLAHRWVQFRFHDKHLVVHRHGQLKVIDLDNRRIVWEKNCANAERAYFSGPPARPIVVNKKVIVPFFDGNKIFLCGFSLDKGEELWKQAANDNVGGDPILVDSSLYVVGIQYQRGDYSDLYVRRVDPTTGETVLNKRIARLRKSEAVYRVGTPVLTDDSLLIRSGGSLICCDLFGNTRWIRKLSYVPPEVDPILLDVQQLDDIVVSGEYVFLNSAGSPHVVCVESATGHEVWSRFAPTLRRVVGQIDDRLIIVEGDKIAALDVKNGKTLWQTRTTADYQSILLGKNETIVAATLDHVPAGNQPNGRLTRRIDWLAADDGVVVKTAEFPNHGESHYDAGAIATNGRVIAALVNLKETAKSGDIVLLEPK